VEQLYAQNWAKPGPARFSDWRKIDCSRCRGIESFRRNFPVHAEFIGQGAKKVVDGRLWTILGFFPYTPQK
jgi:hypothetical protein